MTPPRAEHIAAVISKLRRRETMPTACARCRRARPDRLDGWRVVAASGAERPICAGCVTPSEHLAELAQRRDQLEADAHRLLATGQTQSR